MSRFGKVSIGNVQAFDGMTKKEFVEKFSKDMGSEVEKAWAFVKGELKKHGNRKHTAGRTGAENCESKTGSKTTVAKGSKRGSGKTASKKA